MDIQAAVLRQISQPFQLETLQLEPPRRDEVQVKIAGRRPFVIPMSKWRAAIETKCRCLWCWVTKEPVS